MSPKFQQSQTGFGMATEAGGVGMKRAAPADEGDGADKKVKRAADEGGGADDEADEVKMAADEGGGADDEADEVKMAADEGGGADDEADEVKRANLQRHLQAKRAEMETMKAKGALNRVLGNCHSHASLPTAEAAIEAYRVKTGGKSPDYGPRMENTIIMTMAGREVDKAVIRILIGNGANIDDRNNKGKTALHDQAMNGRLGVMEMLLGFEADINAECDKGNTPLHYAAHCGEAEAVEFLIARGADLVKINKKGQTALEMARDSIFGAAVVPLLEAAAL